ncbi:transcriptional regulator [Minicystis rosea]|nr:transcriptional regulator [Minicystis rosea]
MIYRFGELTLDTESFALRRGAEAVALQRRVFDLIAYLVSHADRLITKEELFERVWGGVAVSEASLAQAVKHARRALGDDADNPSFIITVRGRGYRFAIPVTRDDARPASTTPSAESPAPQRATLAGRGAIMNVLERGLHDARAGHGGMVLISGEPGIGKTRVLDEIAAIAKQKGARVLFARCYLGDEGAPVLWPWVQILRLAATFDAEGVAALGHHHAEAIPDLAPERGTTGIAPSPDPVRARFQLFDAIASFLRRAAEAEAMTIVIDDLQRADEPSLLLLKLLVGLIRDARILVVGAHRSLVTGARGPLADLLGKLSREGACRSMVLEGLDETSVGEVLATGLGAAPAPALVHAVHAQTGGNPFFITQIVHVIAARGGAPEETALPALVLRSSAGEAIRAHLEILSPACREMLAAAAVCGVSFDLAPLAAATEQPTAEIIELLGEAMAGGIVHADERRAGRHRFAHTLVREALHASIALPQRVKLHGRIGRALAAQEQSGAPTSLAGIAYHLLQAAPAGHAAEAATFAVRAAEEAAAKGAHEDAARLYERALEAIDLGPPDPMRRVEVLLALGNARFRAGDLSRSKQIFEQSGRIARSLGAGDKLAEAALGYALEDERSTADKRRIAFLQEGLSAITGGSDARRALLTGRLAVAQYFAAGREARESLAREAVAAARRSGDLPALAFALRCLHFVLLAPDTTEERGDLSGELVSIAAGLDDREGELRALACRIVDRLELGRLHEVDTDIATYGRIAAELGQPAHQWSALLCRAGRALMSAPLDRARALIDEALATGGAGRGFSAGPEGGGLLISLFQLRRAEGRLEEIAPDLAAGVARAPERALRRSLLALVSLARGDRAFAARELEALTADRLTRIRVDLEWLGTVACLAEIAAALDDRDRTALLYDALLPYAGRLVLAGYGVTCLGPVSHWLGVAATALARYEDAERHLEEALSTSRALGTAPFEVKAKLALAEMYARRGAQGDEARARSLAKEAKSAAAQLGLVVTGTLLDGAP